MDATPFDGLKTFLVVVRTTYDPHNIRTKDATNEIERYTIKTCFLRSVTGERGARKGGRFN